MELPQPDNPLAPEIVLRRRLCPQKPFELRE